VLIIPDNGHRSDPTCGHGCSQWPSPSAWWLGSIYRVKEDQHDMRQDMSALKAFL
jgi:hypothetical protein